MSRTNWEHPHGPLPDYDNRFMSGHGGYHTHYVEKAFHGPFRTPYLWQACRNRVANFEVDTGDVVTCKTCLRLPTVKARVGLLVLNPERTREGVTIAKFMMSP